MTAIPFNPFVTYTDSSGNPLVGGKIYTYSAGTNTPLASYTDAGGLTPADPMPAAVEGMKNVISVDFIDQFCSATSCPPVIGNIVVYRDNSHITTTWAKHLEPVLEAAIPAEFKK